MKEVVLSTLRNIARNVVAVLLAVLPDVVAAFQAASVDADLINKGVFAAIIVGLNAVVVFVQRLYEKLNGQPTG